MKLPTFDRNIMEWDTWQAFHIKYEYNKFTQFDTGEFVIHGRRWAPVDRRTYPDLHLQVVATDDINCPRLYIPGQALDLPDSIGDRGIQACPTVPCGDAKPAPQSHVGPIPRSHLTHKGQQVLLLDHDHRRAVSLNGWLTSENAGAGLPERFLYNYKPAPDPDRGPAPDPDRGIERRHSIAAYYAGAASMPVGQPIMRHYPSPLTSAQRARIKDLRDACEVWLGMRAEPVDHELMRQSRDVQIKAAWFVDAEFRMLSAIQRLAIATRGFDMIVEASHPWLTFGGKEEK